MIPSAGPQFDGRILKTFVDSIFSPSAFDGAPLVPSSLLGPALLSPEGTQISSYLEWANSLPDRNPTSWLNLADSAAKVVASAQGGCPVSHQASVLSPTG